MKTKAKPRYQGNKLTPQQFCEKYLPVSWSERDLQLYVQRIIRIRKGGGVLQPADEVVIPTPNSKRRADLCTWWTIYEVKCWLNYDNIYHAVAQTELYARYGEKIFWFIKKRRVIIGVAPIDEKEYQSAVRLAKDFSNLRGIEVVFINERSQWHLKHAHNNQLNKILIGILCFMFLFLVAFCAVVLLRK